MNEHAASEVAEPWLPVDGERQLGLRARCFAVWGQWIPSWFLEAALVRDRASGEPDVHEVLAGIDHEALRVWVLTLLHQQRIDPAAVTLRAVHVGAADVDPVVWESIEIADDSLPEPNPCLRRRTRWCGCSRRRSRPKPTASPPP